MTPQQFKEAILPLKDKIYRFACRMVEDTEEAQDLVQEVFVRLWDRKGDMMQYRSVEAFALTMTRNLCIDWLRASGRLRQADPSEMDLADPVTPYDITEMRDTVTRINQLINHLPERQKVIVHLRDIEGYDFDEIAAILGLNLNVIRVNLSRARKKIKEQLVKVHQYDLQRN